MKFKYFVTSEYGKKTLRPHYHGIYWYDEPYDFAKLWPFGDNNVQVPANSGSFRYVLKYILKGSFIPDGANDNFRLMSRRPGIGSNFKFIYKGEPYILGKNGVKQVPGHYYMRNYLASLDDKLRNIIKEKKLDYLYSQDRFSQLISCYENSDFTGNFEDWLNQVYRKDFLAQIKINSKNGNI